MPESAPGNSRSGGGGELGMLVYLGAGGPWSEEQRRGGAPMVISAGPPRTGGGTIRDAVRRSVLAYDHAAGCPRFSRRCSYSEGAGLRVAIGDGDGGSEATGSSSSSSEEMVQRGAERRKNVLILMSDTGGGHRASAEAIRDAFRIEFGDEYRVFVADVWKEHAGWPLNDMERSYKFMLRHARLWKVAFHGTSPRWVHRSYLAAMAAIYAREVEAGLMKYKPDIIVSVHPLMQHIPLWVLRWQGRRRRRLHGKKVVFVTVVTDLNTCHPTWFHTGVTRCYCPSEEVSRRAFDDGLSPSQIRVFGLPIRPSFCRPVLSDQAELRRELGMDPKLPAVLLMGGGEGIGPVEKTAEALEEALYDVGTGEPVGQIVVVCGRNGALASALGSRGWKVPTKVRGFETQMEKWMGACNCIITKAGPGTIAEALIRGLPIILNDFIPGQEVGNVPYVVENGAGVFSSSPTETASLVARWFGPGAEERKRVAANALRLAQPHAVFDIVRDIDELARQRGGTTARVPYPLDSSPSFPYPI